MHFVRSVCVKRYVDRHEPICREHPTPRKSLFLVMNHFQKKQQGFDLFDFIFKNQTDSIYCASNNTNFEDVKVLVVKILNFGSITHDS